MMLLKKMTTNKHINVLKIGCFHRAMVLGNFQCLGVLLFSIIYSTAKLKLIKKYVEFKKYVLHVKISVYYIVSFTCNIHFLKSTYFIFNQFKSKFSRFFLSFFLLGMVG